MHIAISGASGFLGQHLVKSLSSAGHSLRVLGRRPLSGYPFFRWDPVAGAPPEKAFAGIDAVVHLAGEPVAQRWTPEAKRRIVDSRSKGTRYLVEALADEPVRPRTLICASAIGYYGSRGDEMLTETSSAGTGFLPETCLEWEARAQKAEGLDMRVVRLRIGIVLGPDGGALAKMLPPFRAGVGGPLGGGKQWMSWVHVGDLVSLIEFALMNQNLAGPVNAVSPGPVTNKEFSRVLGDVLHRPAIFPVPAFGLRLLYGEMAEVILGSQRVVPLAASRAGFSFRFSELKPALENVLAC